MVQKTIEQRVDGRKAMDLVLSKLLDEPWNVPRIHDQKVGATHSYRKQETGREREDVIEW